MSDRKINGAVRAAIHDHFVRLAQGIIARHGQVPPAMFAVRAGAGPDRPVEAMVQFENEVVLPVLQGAQQRDRVLALVRTFLDPHSPVHGRSAPAADLVVLVTQAWTTAVLMEQARANPLLLSMKPSQHPARREALVVTLYRRDGEETGVSMIERLPGLRIVPGRLEQQAPTG